MSFIQIDLNALPKALVMADLLGLDQNAVIGGLVRTWEWCWRRKTISIDASLIGAIFKDPARGQEIRMAMIQAGFAEIKGPANLVFICDDQDRLGLNRQSARQQGAAKARAKRKAKRDQSIDPPIDDQSDRALIERDEAEANATIKARSEADQSMINVDRGHQEPRAKSQQGDHDLLGPAETGPLAGSPNSFYPGGGESEPLQVEPALQAESEAKGDHVARAHEDLGGLKQVGEIAKADFLRRFVGAFRANTPPEPQEQPKAEPMPPPEARDSGQQASTPISQPRPHDRPSAISPHEPTAPAALPPLEKIGDLDWEDPVSALQAHIGDVFQATFGRPYFWHRWEFEVLRELLAVASHAAILTRWNADIHELREVKALKRAMMRTNGHAQRFNPNQGIMMGAL